MKDPDKSRPDPLTGPRGTCLVEPTLGAEDGDVTIESGAGTPGHFWSCLLLLVCKKLENPSLFWSQNTTTTRIVLNKSATSLYERSL